MNSDNFVCTHGARLTFLVLTYVKFQNTELISAVTSLFGQTNLTSYTDLHFVSIADDMIQYIHLNQTDQICFVFQLHQNNSARTYVYLMRAVYYLSYF